MRPSVLLGLLAVVSPLSVVLADVSVRSPTAIVATSNDKTIQSALEKAKAAVDELNAMLDQKEVVVVEDEPSPSAVPKEFNNVLEVLANLEAVDDALWDQENERYKRRYNQRYAGVDASKLEAIQKADLTGSAFFMIQEGAVDQLAAAHDKIMSEKKSGMAAAADELDSKLQVLESKVADSIFTKPSASSFYIAAARLREELRLANLPHMIKYNEQARLRESYDRLRKLGVAAVKACTATMAVSALPGMNVVAIVSLFTQVSTAIDLIHEVLETTAEEVERNTMSDAIIILDQMLSGYKETAMETYEKVSAALETARAKVNEKMAEYEAAKQAKRREQALADKKKAEQDAEKQTVQSEEKKATEKAEKEELDRLASELEELQRMMAELEEAQAKADEAQAQV